MVAFNQVCIRIPQKAAQTITDIAGIGQHDHLFAFMMEGVELRLGRIMRNAVALDIDIAQSQHLAHLENVLLLGLDVADDVVHRFPGRFVGIKIHVVLARQDAQAVHVIAVFMRDEDRIHIRKVPANFFHQTSYLLAAQPAVDQYFPFRRLDIGAVAGTAARQIADVHALFFYCFNHT